MKKITIAGINIDIYEDGPVGISLSGGADSAVLLYILLKEIKHPVHAYTFLSEPKRFIAEPVSERVIAKCIELTGNSNVVHHKEYIEKQTPQLLFKTLTDRVKEKEIDMIYAGSSKFPPDDVINTFEEKLEDWLHQHRKSSNVKEEYYGESYYMPWVNLDKKDISKLYSSLDLLDSLYPVTRSCENHLSPDKHCGKCFWCEERLWGFGYLE